jgi:hypothetical protein
MGFVWFDRTDHTAAKNYRIDTDPAAAAAFRRNAAIYHWPRS